MTIWIVAPGELGRTLALRAGVEVEGQIVDVDVERYENVRRELNAAVQTPRSFRVRIALR